MTPKQLREAIRLKDAIKMAVNEACDSNLDVWIIEDESGYRITPHHKSDLPHPNVNLITFVEGFSLREYLHDNDHLSDIENLDYEEMEEQEIREVEEARKYYSDKELIWNPHSHQTEHIKDCKEKVINLLTEQIYESLNL